eukprot:scaffold187845_cov34-Prasinocladus_malaysianus.AAC.1
MARLPNVASSASDWHDLAGCCLRGCHGLLDGAMPPGYDPSRDPVREAALRLLSSSHQLGRWPAWERALGLCGEGAEAERSPAQRTRVILNLMRLVTRLLSGGSIRVCVSTCQAAYVCGCLAAFICPMTVHRIIASCLGTLSYLSKHVGESSHNWPA